MIRLDDDRLRIVSSMELTVCINAIEISAWVTGVRPVRDVIDIPFCSFCNESVLIPLCHSDIHMLIN
jgi:hypothetical protein